MSLLDPPPLRPMTVHRPLAPDIRRKSVFVPGGEETPVADEPRIEGQFRRSARRNERPNR